jgi:hypothetical protein
MERLRSLESARGHREASPSRCQPIIGGDTAFTLALLRIEQIFLTDGGPETDEAFACYHGRLMPTPANFLRSFRPVDQPAETRFISRCNGCC